MNQCDVGSVLRGQVSLTAVNHIPVLSCGYEQVKKNKDSLKACFENVNTSDHLV